MTSDNTHETWRKSIRSMANAHCVEVRLVADREAA